MTGLVLLVSLYVSVLVTAELLYKKGYAAKITRKFVHIGSGIVSFFIPLLVSLRTAVSIGLAFTFLLFLAKRRKALDSVHKIEPDNFGAVLFPLGLIPCALLFWGNPIVFQSSVLVLGFSDGLACIFGRQYGKHGYNVTGPKTAEGSLVFFMTTLIIFILAALYSQQEMNLTKTSYLVLGSLAVTIVEGAFGKGWDNLFVPLSAGFAAQLVLPG